MDLNILKRARAGGEILRNSEYTKLTLPGCVLSEDDMALTFVCSNEDVNAMLSTANITAVICTEQVADDISETFQGGIYVVSNPKVAFYTLHNYLGSKTDFYRESVTSEIHETAFIHPTASVALNNVKIGAECRIGAGVVIKENTNIGKNTIIRVGSVIGTPGFNYFDEEKEHFTVMSYGGVKIGDNVEIHPNVTVEKATFSDETTIGSGSKIGAFTYIGHDTQIGLRCKVMPGVIFEAYTSSGDDSQIGSRALIGRGSSVDAGKTISSGAIITPERNDI